MTDGPRALSCPNCGAPIVVRAVGNTVTVVCGNCGSSLDATDPDLTILKQSIAAGARSRIPLGTRGFLAGIEWEAIGFLERSGGGGSWQETLLFNPWEGYRFLVDDGETWRLGTPLDRLPTEAGEIATLGGDRFTRIESYQAQVDFVVGEFYWRVAVGETVDVCDYEGLGEASLSREANAAEVAWTRLEPQGDGVVESAFGIAPVAPQRSAGLDDERAPTFNTIVAGIATFLLLAVLMLAPWGVTVLDTTVVVIPDGPAAAAKFGPVALDRRRSGVAVRGSADLENAWVELDFALVNRATQERYEASATAEHYRGRDSDGEWTEGDRRPDVTFAALPRGSYDLVVEATAHVWPARQSWERPAAASEPPIPVRVTVTRNATFWGVLWLALIVIWAIPLTQWFFWYQRNNDE